MFEGIIVIVIFVFCMAMLVWHVDTVNKDNRK